MTRLFTVGLSHRTAPVELRESVDFSRGGAGEALAALASRGISKEMVVLSTCNRAEVYAVAGPEGPDAVARFFAEYHELPLARLTDHLYVRRGEEAARHLFRVAAGLDSLVVGEPQILGQVKTAYSAASDRGYTSSTINRLFHTAFGVGKRVRRETGLSEGAVSVSYAAIALARKIFGDLTGLNVLILGAGGMAKLTGTHLKAQQVRQITIASRTLAAADRLARQLDGQAVGLDRSHRGPVDRRHRHHRHRRRGAGAHARQRRRRDAAAPPAAALHHRHRRTARRRAERRRPRTGLSLQHRRPPGHRQREPDAPIERAGAGGSDRRGRGREVQRVAALA